MRGHEEAIVRCKTAGLVITVVLSAPLLAVSLAAAQTSAGVLFSRPVPFIHPGAEYRTCHVGIFQGLQNLPLIHQWYVMARRVDIQEFALRITAFAAGDGESGELRATVTDVVNNEIGSVSLRYPALQGEITQDMPLELVGGVIYTLTLESRPTGLGAQHYKLGAIERSVELGWAGPLHYLEVPTANWAFHAQQGEEVTVRIEVDAMVDAGRRVPGVPEQATSVTYAVWDANLMLGPVLQTTANISATQPIDITFTSDEDQSFILQVGANGHYRMARLSGADRGFYATPCPPPPLQPFRVTVDIKPGDERNSQSCKAVKARLPVAILTDATFDATMVDADSVRFGKTGTEAAEVHKDEDDHAKRHVEDVNGDGLLDMVFHFRFEDTGFTCDDLEGRKSVALPAKLTGTANETPIVGEDALRLVTGR
jgi:hypothetical protein